MATSKNMTKEKVIRRRASILYFINAVGKVVIRHIHKLHFENYHVAKNYMRELERKGLVNSRRAFVTGEKVFYLTKLGVEFIQTQYPDDEIKYTQVRININNLEHDLIVTDILLNISTNGFKVQGGKLTLDKFKTDRTLQRERWEAADGNKKALYRVPDMHLFMQKDHADKKETEIIVEYEHTRRPAVHIENDLEDYLEYFPNSIILIVSNQPERMDYYCNKVHQYLSRRKNIVFWVGHYDFLNDKLEYYNGKIQEEKQEEKVEEKKEETQQEIIKAFKDYFGTTYDTHKVKFIEVYNETKKKDYFGYKDYFDTAFVKTISAAKEVYQEKKFSKSIENILIAELQHSGIVKKEVKQ
jgi:predicted transcriptional regulator